ncbi:MAG TPA: ethanolamine ammonia-lyase reactivating factor EutA [Micropepsaceae bacterium]|nr:ethanolamine ammonia-lyase reactivating factor EutA [Micropepsaceae bacterium]
MTAPPQDKKTGSHALADHRLGDALHHQHDEQSDHDHDDFEADGPLEENPLWIQDHVTLTTVGIDIGSSGTQVIFSKINLRRLSEDLTSRYYVVSRETLFLSPVSLTPYQSETRIDDLALKEIIAQAYRDATVAPKDVDSGAVILTGEALRRENAQAIAAMLAETGGDFVCAAAGHHMESMLAAYGSGASRVSNETGARILNIDIGGGTTKLAVVEAGKVIATAAVHIGGRLQVVDASGRIVRLDPAGETHARRAGYAWQLGSLAQETELDRVAGQMADTLIAALSANPPAAAASLYLTDPLPSLDGITGVMASGGVAEYIYGRETRDFGDMGRRLGTAIAMRFAAGRFPWPLLPAGECIRATALGASEYTVQLSGNTSYISNAGALLPKRNLQVLQPDFTFGDDVDSGALCDAIRAHRRRFDAANSGAEIALAFRWRGAPAYERLHACARGLVAGLADKVAARRPIYLMLDGDVAQTLGAIMREDCKVESEILCIDGVMLMDFDYIDLGRVRVPSYTVPVTIKSLVFSDDPARNRERIHHRRDDAHQHRGHDPVHTHD